MASGLLKRSAAVLMVLPGVAVAACETAVADLQARLGTEDIALLTDGARALQASGCSDAVVTSSLRQVASMAARRANAALGSGDAAGALALLEAAPVLHWEVLAMRGALQARVGDFASAAQFYNEALDVLGAPSLTPQDPALEVVVPRLMALAQESMMLADSTQTSIRSDGTASGLMRAISGGLSVRQDAGNAPTSTGAGQPGALEKSDDYNVVTSAAAGVEQVFLPVRFAFGSAELNEIGQREARRLAAFLRRQTGVERLTLLGHTDEIGSAENNLALSLRRAETMRGFLLAEGVQMEIETLGRGEAEPPRLVDSTAYTDEQRRAIARRVEISFDTH